MISISIFLGVLLGLISNNTFWGRLFIGLGMAVAFGTTIYLYYKKETTKTDSSVNQHNSKVTIESIYDQEITEYYFFQELKTLDENNKKVVFVIDELDKLDNECVGRIINDLKSLLLSPFCNSVLIGGINFEEELLSEQKGMDRIATSLFNYRIYMPLAETKDYEFLASHIFNGVKIDLINDKSDFSNLIKIQALESKGIKRTFINSIISKAVFSEDDKMYEMEYSSDYIDEKAALLGYYNGFTALEDALGQKLLDERFLEKDISLQYGLYTIYFLVNNDDTSLEISEIRIKVDLIIPDYDNSYIQKILSKNQREKIIEIILNRSSAESIADNPDIVKPEEDSKTSGNSVANALKHNDKRVFSSGVIERVYNLLKDSRTGYTPTDECDDYRRESFASFQWMLADNGILLEKNELSIIREVYRFIFYFSVYLRVPMNSLCKAYNMLFMHKYSDDLVLRSSTLSDENKLLIKIISHCRSNNKILGVEVLNNLTKLWYCLNLEEEEGKAFLIQNMELYNKFMHRGFDIVDKYNHLAFEVKYYKSSAYAMRYQQSIEDMFVKDISNYSDYLLSNIKRVACIVFVSRQSEEYLRENDTEFDIKNKKLNMSLFYISLQDFDSFSSMMGEMEEFLLS